MTAAPGERPVTCPLCDTDATPTLFVVQTTPRPVITPPSASNAVATRFSEAATGRVALSGAMRTDATRAGGATTVTDATADFPSADAATSTRPALTAVTT